MDAKRSRAKRDASIAEVMMPKQQQRIATPPTIGLGAKGLELGGPRISIKSAVYERTKRTMDVCVATLVLILLSPLMLLVAVLIKLSDFGPVLFCQTRVGRGGRHFTCYKFRSMVPHAESLKESLMDLNHHQTGPTFKIPQDPRLTRLGILLRKTSLDEFPQLWNVIKGDMSLVGPRPPVPPEVIWYTDFDMRRLEVRPGLTCIWQVNGRSDIPFDGQVRMDVEYIVNRSTWLDLKLLLLTIPAVVSGKGAY